MKCYSLIKKRCSDQYVLGSPLILNIKNDTNGFIKVVKIIKLKPVIFLLLPVLRIKSSWDNLYECRRMTLNSVSNTKL